MKPTYFILSLFLSISICSFGQKNIVILHTNDTHSRIEPIPETDRNAPDKGGVVRRASYVEQVRKENKNVLLFDSGDFLQGTPYFNLFKGRVEVEVMNLMKYDAVTLGNHEFDYGMEALESVVKMADFPIVCSNYDFSQTSLSELIKPYVIFQKDGVRIGVMSLNIRPQGLVASENYKGMIFLDPVGSANKIVQELRVKHKCDMVICLSHLGYSDDVKLVQKTNNIDIILGGHSHTFMEKPETHKNIDNKEVLIYQTAGRGAYVGRIDVELEKVRK